MVELLIYNLMTLDMDYEMAQTMAITQRRNIVQLIHPTINNYHVQYTFCLHFPLFLYT
jgi:hypothetical protein